MQFYPSIDAFTQGYLEALSWTEEEELTRGQWSAKLIKQAVKDCFRFQEENATDLETYYETSGRSKTDAGQDFWLTRNGHGAGFWDHSGDKTALARLSKSCKGYGEVGLYLGDDSQVYPTK